MTVRATLVAAAVGVAAAGCPSFHAGPLPGAPADATFADVDGVHLHYRAVGSGPAVVMLHGYGASIDLWRPVQDALAAHHRVIAVDLKGFGWSSRPPGDYSPAAEAELVWHLLDQLGVDQVSIVGHSWGSSVSLAMVLAQPARVRRIALYAAYVYDEQLPSFFRWARIGGLGEVLFALHYQNNAEDRIGLAYHDARFITQARVEHVLAELARPGTTAAALAAARDQRFTAMSRRYHEITQPTLLLWGDDDRVTPLTYGQRLVGTLADARLNVYPACGHIPMVEAATATTRDLVEFLDADRATSTTAAPAMPPLDDAEPEPAAAPAEAP
ncbi:MAG: alpha/beta fold hydrolase [Myxococcales bacterium]|nr:alpha/beta fold hydrolase [Myxococcales bacterium]